MHKWQNDIINKLTGWAPGEMVVWSAGRQTGKSQMAEYMKMFYQMYYQEVPSLELDEGKVFGQPYYTVKPKGIPWYEMEPWCRETFGPTPEFGVWEPNARWYMNAEQFWFRDEKDRMLFVLRWSR